MGLFGGSTTTKTQVELNPQQKKLVDLAMPNAETYAHQDLSLRAPGGPALTPMQQRRLQHLRQLSATGGVMTPQQRARLQRLNAAQRAHRTMTPLPIAAKATDAQRQGQDMALAAASGAQTDLANQGADTSKFLLHDVLFPGSNPALQATMDAAARPITQALTESELPALRSGAAVAGQYGSSRQGIAEGLASGRASQAIGDTSAKIANANYQAGLDAQTKALGLLPSTQGAQLAPAVTTSGVGDVRQAQQQKQIDANLARFFYNKGIPLQKATNLMGMATGTPGGGTSSSASGSTSLLNGALGGASLGTAIMPGVGTAAGAGIGALLAALG